MSFRDFLLESQYKPKIKGTPFFKYSALSELLSDAGYSLNDIATHLNKFNEIPLSYAKRVVKEEYAQGIIFNYLNNADKLVSLENLCAFLANQIKHVKVDFIFDYQETRYITKSSPYYSNAQRKNAIRFKLALYMYPNLNTNDAIRKLSSYGDITNIELAGTQKGKRV